MPFEHLRSERSFTFRIDKEVEIEKQDFVVNHERTDGIVFDIVSLRSGSNHTDHIPDHHPAHKPRDYYYPSYTACTISTRAWY